MVRLLLVVVGLAACGGPVEETLVDELRVLASIPSAPEARPGEAVDVAVTVVEPEGEPVDVLVWACSPTFDAGPRCAEAGGALEDAAVVVRGVQTDALAPLRIHDMAPYGASQVWTLACEPGLCPLIDEVAAKPAAGTPAHDAILEAFADPTPTLAGLPLSGVAASKRRLWVSLESDETRNRNPTVSGAVGASSVSPGGELSFSLAVEDDDDEQDLAFGYATAGGFIEAATEVIDGRAAMTWLAPEEPTGRVDIFVVVADGFGGEALWRASVAVDEVR